MAKVLRKRHRKKIRGMPKNGMIPKKIDVAKMVRDNSKKIVSSQKVCRKIQKKRVEFLGHGHKRLRLRRRLTLRTSRCIYVIVLYSKVCYVGSTIRTAKERYREHLCDVRAVQRGENGSAIHNKMSCVGLSNYFMYVVDILPRTVGETKKHFTRRLRELEDEWILFFNTLECGLNERCNYAVKIDDDSEKVDPGCENDSGKNAVNFVFDGNSNEKSECCVVYADESGEINVIEDCDVDGDLEMKNAFESENSDLEMKNAFESENDVMEDEEDEEDFDVGEGGGSSGGGKNSCYVCKRDFYGNYARTCFYSQYPVFALKMADFFRVVRCLVNFSLVTKRTKHVSKVREVIRRCEKICEDDILMLLMTSHTQKVTS